MTTHELGPSAAQIALMGQRIDAGTRRIDRVRRVRTRIAVGAAVLGLAAAITGAAVAIAAAGAPEQARVFDCHLTADPAGEAGRIWFDDQGLDAGSRVELAVTLCADRYALLGETVPQPTACELPDLRLAVFPNVERLDEEAFCASLGLGVARE